MQSRALTVFGILVLGACADPTGGSAPAGNRFDHVMVGIADLDSGIDMVADLTGVAPAYGGIHPGRDTRNALLSLGEGSYFELIAPQAELASITDSIALATLELSVPTPIHWAVATADIESTRSLVQAQGWQTTPIDARSRELPDGSTLSWRMFFITDDPEAASIPFFIQWDDMALHPSGTSPAGCEFTRMEIRTPRAERVGALLDELGIPIEVRRSETDSLDLQLLCGETIVSF